MTDKYEFIDRMRSHAKYAFPVEFMCTRLGVSKSGYYDWRSRPVSATAKRRTELTVLIRKAFDDSDGTYGHRRIHEQLTRWGHPCSPELVRALMRDAGLVSCQPRPRRNLTTGTASPVDDLVCRDFTADAPGTKLVGDITYIPTKEGWLYLATVIDCCTKEVIGYAMADHYRTSLIEQAIRNAARNRTLQPRAIFHSDRGSNYMSGDYARVLTELDLRQSAGRTGVCYDNSMAESFFGTLKNERVHRVTYLTRQAAQQDITRYIEFWYNRKRFHSAIGYHTPHEARLAHENQQPAA